MLTALYDLQVSPASYDVVAFLLAAERWRLRAGEDRVRIEILPGPWCGFRQDSFWPQNIEQRKQMLDRVVVPMCKMLPSADVVVRTDRPQRRDARDAMGFLTPLYGLRLQVEVMAEGIRPLRADAAAQLRCPKLVTITLREAEHWPGRNSNTEAWVHAARELAGRGYRVSVIRDTRRADEPLDGVGTSPYASLDLAHRAALYRSAVCNMFVNNGPAWFCLALDAPVLILKPTVENVQRACSRDYFESCGIAYGGQIPGSPPHQRIVWAEDTTAEIVSAFEEFMGR